MAAGAGGSRPVYIQTWISQTCWRAVESGLSKLAFPSTHSSHLVDKKKSLRQSLWALEFFSESGNREKM